MPGRSFSTQAYRYGFNGKEKDDEVKGRGNSIDFGARIHDPRLGRFLSIDPYFKEFAWSTPYSYSVDNPVALIDNYGEAPGDANLMNATQTGTSKVVTETEKKIAKKFVEQALNKAFRQAWWDPILTGAGAILSKAAGVLALVTTDQGLGKGDVVVNQLDKEEQIELQNLQGKKAQGVELSGSENSRLQELEYREVVSSFKMPSYGNVTVSYNGSQVPIFRGGGLFDLKEGEYKVTPGGKYPARGLSLDADLESAKSRPGGAYKITYLPPELQIIHTPSTKNPAHFDIIPKDLTTTEKQFQELLKKIEREPVN